MRAKFGLFGTCAVLAALVALVSASADVAREAARSGRIAFIEGERGVIYTVRPDGTGKRRVTPTRRPQDRIDETFAWSPDGRKIAYSWDDYGYRRNPSYTDLFVIPAVGGKPRLVGRTGADEINPAWSPDGKRIAYDLYDDGYWAVWVTNADGTRKHKVTPGIHFHGAAWSPDGRKIAFSDREAIAWTMDFPGRVPRRVALPAPRNPARLRFRTIVAWSPHGRQLAFISGYDIWVKTGNGQPQRIFTGGSDDTHNPTEDLAWSPDGRKLAFAHFTDSNSDSDIYTINADGTGLRRLTTGSATDRSPSWSPDGSALAFNAGFEIEVMNADGSNQRNISQNAKKKDYAPRWAPAA
jgi:TolB protein